MNIINELGSNILSDKTISKLSEVAINPGANFLTGQISTALLYDPTDVDNNNKMCAFRQGLYATTSFATEAVKTFAEAGSALGSTLNALDMAPEIMAEAASYISNTIVSYAIDVATGFTTLPLGIPRYMTERIAFWTKEQIVDPTTYLKELNNDAEYLIMEPVEVTNMQTGETHTERPVYPPNDFEFFISGENAVYGDQYDEEFKKQPWCYADRYYKALEKRQTADVQRRTNNKALSELNKASKKFAELNQEAIAGIEKYKDFIEEGPEKLEKGLKNFFKKIEYKMREGVKDAYDTCYHTIYDNVDIACKAIGKVCAAPVNLITKEATKKLVDGAKFELSKADMNSKNLKIVAAMKLKAMFGV